MSGPIVRSGPSDKFTSNWDQVFGGGKKAAAKSAKAQSKSAAPKKKAQAKAKPKASKKK